MKVFFFFITLKQDCVNKKHVVVCTFKLYNKGSSQETHLPCANYTPLQNPPFFRPQLYIILTFCEIFSLLAGIA